MRSGRSIRARGGVRSLAIALLATACGAEVEIDRSGPTGGWPHYGGDAGGTRHSPVAQITPENVHALEVAWTHRTGDLVPEWGSFQATPILRDGTLYLCTPRNVVQALDAATGALRWSFDPEVDARRIPVVTCRGVSFWRDPAAEPGAVCAERVFTGTIDARLIALDARTGQPCADFGEAGEVDLGEGIGDTRPGEYGVTSPPVVIDGKVVTGSLIQDNKRVEAPSGVVRAFDARSGERRWAWDPMPEADRRAWAGRSRYRRGTTNAWSILAADPERGLVFVPTGNTSPDYFGGLREGLDLYSSSLVALDAGTGEVAWHFQTVHHDLWDYDVPAQPLLFDFPGSEGPVPAVAQVTKMGHVFVLDRETGEPLLPVEERPVPQGGVEGEALSPTQPFPVRPPPLHSARLEPEDAWGFTFWDRGQCRARIEGLRRDGLFTPPTLEGSLQWPGMAGGSNWGSAAWDPASGRLVTTQTRTAASIRLATRREYRAWAQGGQRPPRLAPMEGTPYALERRALRSPLGAPCNPPPWGTLTAVDLASGEIAWEVPLGTTRDRAPWPLWLPTGTPVAGGAIVTGSGLVFVAATRDHFLRAFDLANGEEVWRGRLPAPGAATPMTYRLGPEARQMVVIAAGGHGLLGDERSDAVVAFALPER